MSELTATFTCLHGIYHGLWPVTTHAGQTRVKLMQSFALWQGVYIIYRNAANEPLYVGSAGSWSEVQTGSKFLAKRFASAFLRQRPHTPSTGAPMYGGMGRQLLVCRQLVTTSKSLFLIYVSSRFMCPTPRRPVCLNTCCSRAA